MSPKRNDRVAPPPRPGEWGIRYLTTEAARGWEDLCRHAPGNTRNAYEVMRASPRPPEDNRHHRLRYDLATRKVGAQELEQWQIEVTGGGRVWYVIDDAAHTVWLTLAGTGHPRRQIRPLPAPGSSAPPRGVALGLPPGEGPRPTPEGHHPRRRLRSAASS